MARHLFLWLFPQGNTEIIELLLKKGAKIDKESAPYIADIFFKTGDENPDLKKKILEALIDSIEEVGEKDCAFFDLIFSVITKEMPQVAVVEQGFEISGAAASAAPSADYYSESKKRLLEKLGEMLAEITKEEQPSSSPAANSTQPAVEGGVESVRE